jgi:hypothetical protein
VTNGCIGGAGARTELEKFMAVDIDALLEY